MALTFHVKPGAAGMIVFTFADVRANEFIDLAAFTFKTTEALQAHWEKVPVAGTKDTAFIADIYNGDNDLVDDRPVTAETIEAISGRCIADLIAEGRKALNDYYDAEDSGRLEPRTAGQS